MALRQAGAQYGLGDLAAKKRRYCVADLNVLFGTRTSKVETVGEGLQPRRFTNRQHTILFGMDIGTSMNVALRKDGRGYSAFPQATVALSMVRRARCMPAGNRS